ncbi:MAG: RluA family pseudouridine synthase, partial [Candidatus Omnitrophica bacterium]|nr:RluA family pseudouridine synthase [Candidatus Omnitrophota bacterium]
MTTERLTVEEEQASLRLDLFLKQFLPEECSRTFIQQLINDNKVTVNGANVKSHYKVVVRDEIVVDLPEFSDKQQPASEKIDLDIFYEDEDIIVVNKPSGMLVHPVHGKDHGTLVNALLYHCKQLADVGGPTRPGIVHRLDRETSGL